MKGIRVVDMTSVLSGPFCTWLLASLGADVIKVENPNGDTSRTTPPFKDGVGLYFASVNRNKRSIKLDLKTDDGKAVLHKLLASADVFVENMRPGVRDRLGCGDEELKAINPKLISASISGFGQKGSLSDRPAYDIVVQAMSGMMSINGELGGSPTRVGFSVGDISAAMFAVIGILQRLYERDAQGKDNIGHLDVSMLACQWACLENAFARHLNTGVVPGPIGSRHPSSTPFEPYPTADQDIVIGLGSEKDWAPFCKAIGLTSLLIDPRFQGAETRLANRDELDEVLGNYLQKKPSSYWMDLLIKNSIPCSVIENIESISNNLISEEYKAFSEIEVGTTKQKMRFVRNPISS
jgi:CoA:oxalate CoA-transferase